MVYWPFILFRQVTAQGLNRLSIVVLLVGAGFFVWGIMGFRREMSKR